MIRNHHERWDGKGYPDGLVGEQTPLLARLLHIADCYDAILSEKVYSAGTSPQQALAEICLGSGTEFDPSLTEAFAALLREEGIVLPEVLTLALARQNKNVGILQS
jgi:HD-GYP domain-containing protein (c-di-GMP phosphodiesterase class II)